MGSCLRASGCECERAFYLSVKGARVYIVTMSVFASLCVGVCCGSALGSLHLHCEEQSTDDGRHVPCSYTFGQAAGGLSCSIFITVHGCQAFTSWLGFLRPRAHRTTASTCTSTVFIRENLSSFDCTQLTVVRSFTLCTWKMRAICVIRVTWRRRPS